MVPLEDVFVCLKKKKKKRTRVCFSLYNPHTSRPTLHPAPQIHRNVSQSLSLSGITVSSPSFLQSAPKRATAQTECANICNAKPFVHDVTKTTCHNKEVFFCFVFFSPEISFDTGRSLHRNRLCY